jgi:hypothetical protein
MAAIGTSTKVTFNMIDHSGEPTRSVLHFVAMEDDGSNLATILTAVGVAQAAILAASDCNHVSTIISVETDTTAAVPPSTVTAQREIAVRVKMVGADTNEITSFTVPGPATGFYPPTGVKGDYIPLDNAVFSVLITAMEAILKTPGGEDVEVVEGRLVGRNS